VSLERAIELVQEKRKADAPLGTYKGIPFTKGKGRFGPFIKWDKLYVNIPARYNPETISPNEMIELIQAKLEKEANRYILQWEEEGIAVENGRWGPFIRFGKKNVKIPRENGAKITAEEAAELSLEEVKKMIEAEIPDAFAKKTTKRKAKSK
jgi:DNA topoisomerase-1